MKSGTKLALLLAVLLPVVLISCGNPNKQLETRLGYDALYKTLRSENEDLVKSRSQETAFEQETPDIADAVEPVLPEFNPLEENTISISVQEETIHNILYIVARNAGLNLVIEPGISLDNKATISFEDASSALVVDKLLEAYDLAWEVKDNILYVKRFDEMVFDLDFVNTMTEVSVNNGGDIFGNLASAGEGGGSLSGEFTMANTAGGEFDDDSVYGFILQSVDSIISEETAFGEQEVTGDEPENPGYFALDPLGGQLLVRTTPNKLRSIAKMLNNLRRRMSRQIVINARILEVRLSDQFNLGIDWNWVSNRVAHSELGGDAGANLSFVGRGVVGQADNPNSILTLTGLKKGDDAINAVVDAMETFGGVKVVANPHVRTRHAQPALFTSGTSESYVKSVDRDEDTDGNVTYTTTTSSVFDGVMLGVIPHITDDDRIDLQIYPIKSEVDDGSLELQTVTQGGEQISLPRVDVKSVSTAVKVKDGDTVILGGLIDKETSKEDNGIPGLMNIPVFGWLFKGRAQTEVVRELVIIMNIRIVK